MPPERSEGLLNPDSILAQSNSDRFVLQALRRPGSRTFVRGQNARLWDIHGKSYLDTMSGSAGPAMVGHANPRVTAAVSRQLAELPSVNVLHGSARVNELGERLAGIAPAGLAKTFLCAGGGEAIEAAVKVAMLVTGKTCVLSLTGGYHGMSLATATMTGEPEVRWPAFHKIAAGSPRELDAAIREIGADRIAALVMEVIQGPSGHIVFLNNYVADVSRICRANDILIIADEIQTGLGRCGEMWACDLVSLEPEILVVGKALGGGLPVGAVVANASLIPPELESGKWHILTFMNQPLAAAAAIAVLDIIEDDGLVDRAKQLGAQATAHFDKLSHSYSALADVRGPGLFIGLELIDPHTGAPPTDACRDAWEHGLDCGLITQFGGPASNVLMFKPPLTTPESDFAQMLELVEQVVAFVDRAVSGE